MGEGIAVIDLGDLAPAGADDVLPPLSAGVRRRRWRVLGTVVVAVLASVVLTAGGPPPPALAGGFTVPLVRAWYTFADEAVYLVSGTEEVTAYSFEDGHLLWRAAVPHEVSYLNMRGGPIAVHDEGACSTLSRLDPATGAVSWTRTGALVGDESVDGMVRIVHDLEGSCADGTGEAVPPGSEGVIDVATMPQALDVVDPRTGVTRVSITFRGGMEWTFGPLAATVALWDRQGHLVERDLTTGATLVSGDIPALANATGTLTNMMPSVWGFDDVWVVLDPPSLMADDTMARVSAYDRRTLAPRWTVSLPAPPADTRQYFGLWGCAPTTICVQVGETQLVELDVTTGAQVSAPGEQEQGYPVGRDWVIGSDPDPRTAGLGPVLRDRRTGRNVFPTWHMVTFTEDVGGSLVLSRKIGDVTEFALFEGGRGRLRTLGAAPGDYSGCDLAEGRLLCVDGHLVLHVWPIRR